MAQYPNGRYLTVTRGRAFGPGAGLEVYARRLGDRIAQLTAFAPTASGPDGYGVAGLVPARVAGSMSALRSIASVAGAASLLQGGPMVGAGALSLSVPTASLSLITSMAGSASIAWTAAPAALSSVLALSGSGSVALTGSGALSMIVPFDGTGAITFTGAADLKGRLSMEGSWTPFTALSPETLADAVWSRLVEAGFTAEDVLRLLAAHAAGSATGLEGGTAQFTGLDGVTVRIEGAYSAGTRTIQALNGS